jgi:hypothetical protein
MKELSPESKRLFALTREAMTPDANEIAALRETLAAKLPRSPAPLRRPALASGPAAKLALTLGSLSLAAAAVIWSRAPENASRHAERSLPVVPERAVAVAPLPAAPVAQSADAAPPRVAVTSHAPAGQRADGKRRPRSAPSTPAVQRGAAPSGIHGASAADDSLASELALLRAARAALERHEPAAALSWLAQHAQRFPHGSLRQERMASRARALCALDRRAEARAAARELAREVPGSPYLAAISCSESGE